MSYLPSLLTNAGAIVLLVCLAGAPARAAAPVTFVSGKGADTGTCAAPANPCRTINYALSRTSPFGEIKALDPAHYGGVTIATSVNITGVPGASIGRKSGNAIVIKAGGSDVINISHFTVDGGKTANNGVVFNSGGSLNITHSVFRNFLSNGILIQPKSGTTRFMIAHVTASNNAGAGVMIFPTVTAVVTGTLDHVLLQHNGSGLYTNRNTNDTIVRVTVNQSVASGNQTYGFVAASQGVLRLNHSVSTDNGYGVFVNTTAVTAGNNFIHGNTTADVAGGMGSIPLR
jgi:hypothetical protein